MIATNCASALSSAHNVWIFCYLFIVVVNDNDGDLFFSFNVIYDYIWIYEYKQSIGLQGRALGAATFFLHFEKFP